MYKHSKVIIVSAAGQSVKNDPCAARLPPQAAPRPFTWDLAVDDAGPADTASTGVCVENGPAGPALLVGYVPAPPFSCLP